MERESIPRGDSEMTRAARLIYTIAILGGLFLGSFLGFHRTTLRLNAESEAQRSIAQLELADFSGIQYRHADHDHARAALLMYENFLEQMEKTKSESILKLNLSITFTRLALLEGLAHNREQSRAYMNEATSWCAAGGRRDCSESELKKKTEEFDKRQSIYEP
jgi:hypothetical protein